MAESKVKTPKTKRAPVSRARISFERAKREHTPSHIKALEAQIREEGLDPENDALHEVLSVYGDWLLQVGDLRGEMLLSQIRCEVLWVQIQGHRDALRLEGKKVCYKSKYKRKLKDGKIREYTTWKKTPKENELRREMRTYSTRLRQLILSCKKWAGRTTLPVSVDWELGFATRVCLPSRLASGTSRRSRSFRNLLAGTPRSQMTTLPEGVSSFVCDLAMGDSGSLLSELELMRALDIGIPVVQQMESWPLEARSQFTKLKIQSETYEAVLVDRIISMFPNVTGVHLSEGAQGSGSGLVESLRRVARDHLAPLKHLYIESFTSPQLRWCADDFRDLLKIPWGGLLRYSVVVSADEAEFAVDTIAQMEGLLDVLPNLVSFHLHITDVVDMNDSWWEDLDRKWRENGDKFPTRRWLLHSW